MSVVANQTGKGITCTRKGKVLTILAFEEGSLPTRRKDPKCVQWPDIEALARRIFSDRCLATLVLLERDLRGDD